MSGLRQSAPGIRSKIAADVDIPVPNKVDSLDALAGSDLDNSLANLKSPRAQYYVVKYSIIVLHTALLAPTRTQRSCFNLCTERAKRSEVTILKHPVVLFEVDEIMQHIVRCRWIDLDGKFVSPSNSRESITYIDCSSVDLAEATRR